MGTELFHEDGRNDGQPDRRDEANSRFSQFCDSAKKCKLTSYFKWQVVYKSEHSPCSYRSAYTSTRDYYLIYAHLHWMNRENDITSTTQVMYVFYGTLKVHYHIHNISSQNYTLNHVSTTTFVFYWWSILILPAHSISFYPSASSDVEFSAVIRTWILNYL